MTPTLTAIILAAGESKRMRSRRPKVLHPLCGRPLIEYPVQVTRALGARVVLVVGRAADEVRAKVGTAADLSYVEQSERRGTGHAVLQARAACSAAGGIILVLPADHPLMSETLLRGLVEHHRATGAAATYVDDTVTVGPDTVLYPGVTLEGATHIGAECVIGTGSQIAASRLGDKVLVKPYCVLTEAVVEEGAQLGPFCHLRPLSHVGPQAKIGNFVELKKSKIGRGAKVPHLSYVGDAQVGAEANIGAGTITCNYDGVNKHETVIGAGAFVGTNSSLVAPVTIGEGAYVAAGSVITKSVPAGALAVARGRQETREGWAARRKAARKAKE